VLAIVDRWVVGRSIYDTHELVSTSAWSLTFAGNWAIVVDQGLEPLGHLWSISLEAQFYALWALSLVVALRSRRPYVVAGAMALSGVALVAAWRWVSYASHPDDVFAHYVSAFTRLDAPLIGAVAGICVARGWTRRIDGWAADICLIAGLGVLIWAAATAEPFEPALFRGGFTLVALAAALAVVGSVHGGRRGAARVLRSRPLVAAGRVSYSLYLWHVPVFVLVGREAATRSQPVRCLLGLVLAGTLSWVSYRYVEQPFLRRKGGRAPERTSGTVTSPAVAS
jgi:peptidoglycan/LPS O-acetylase OafA/YrhL